MTAGADPFAHHPELRDRIEDPAEATFFRTFDMEALFADKPELRWVLDVFHSDETREAIRRAALADHEGDLWVFGYGSLMWNPAIFFAEVRRATLPGHARRFILREILGARGTRERPGLLAALDTGNGCEGLAFRIAAADVETETELLWRRECVAPGYIPAFVEAETAAGPIRALTFLADHAAPSIAPDLDFAEQVRLIATGAGFLGSSRDYLANVVEHFETLDIHDAECVTLLEAVDRYISDRHGGPVS